MTQEINYTFAIGRRCNATDLVQNFGIGTFWGPFDYTFASIDASFENINNKFENYLNDIVYFRKGKKDLTVLYPKNTTKPDKFFESLEQHQLTYMNHDYNVIDLRINQNFLPTNITGHVYDWNKLCIFHHNDVLQQNEYEKIKRRIKRFNHVYETVPDKVLLLYLTEIINDANVENYIKNVVKLAKKYNIKSHLVVIICSDNTKPMSTIKHNNILFIIRNVPSYQTQTITGIRTDNNIGHAQYYDVRDEIKKHFNFNLLPKIF